MCLFEERLIKVAVVGMPNSQAGDNRKQPSSTSLELKLLGVAPMEGGKNGS
jgi:hypothetical protein